MYRKMMFSMAVGIPGTFHGTGIGVSIPFVRRGQNVSRTVGLPASPRLRQMLQNSLRLILLDGLGHHVQDIMHDSSTKFKVIMRFNTLLGHGLCNTLAISAFELAGQKISQPRVLVSTTAKSQHDWL